MVMLRISELPKYDAYKDSGEDWIDQIPSHWEIRKLKNIFYEKKHRRNMNLNSGAISFGKVVVKGDEKIQESTKASYQEVLAGDFLINPLNLNYDLISLRIALSEIDVVVSAGYIVIKEHSPIDKGYFKYLLHRYDVAYMKLLGSGVCQTISFNHISNSLLLYPTLEEQALIAKFLDKKTTQIDEAIAIKEQQIALLKERKQIIIQQAVTQGLDPTVPMKDSGVDWIGEIPVHWDFSKMKYYIDILAGYAFKSESYSLNDSDVALLRGINVSPSYIRWGETVFWPKFKLKGFERYLLQEGDIVIAMDRPWISGGIRVAVVAQDDLPSLLLQRVARIRGEDELLTDYAKVLLSTNLFLYYFEPMLTGISVPHISPEQIENFTIPVPPIDEQREILRYIDDESKNIQQAISIQRKQIKKLKEYKTTLINSAVTGKIKITPDMAED